MKLTKLILIGLLVQTVLAHLSWALGPVVFGPEFTFFDPQRPHRERVEIRDQIISRMRSHLVDGQPEGAKFSLTDVIDFVSPNGWGFAVGTDPGVAEIRMTPGSVDFFRQFKDDMQDAIFASAANEGFFPALFQGGGHINLGMSAFAGNSLLLRNFVVDTMINQNELFLGVFNYDTRNAGSFSIFAQDAQLAIYKVIEKFDRGEFVGDNVQEDFLNAIQRIQAKETDDYLKFWFSHEIILPVRSKRAAVNFSHVSPPGPESRIEIRGVRPQASMDVWVRQIDLIYHRLLYLEKIKTPIPIRWRVDIKSHDFVNEQSHLNPPVNPQDVFQAFYTYVTEAGLPWQEHRDYLWPQWITNGEVNKFEHSLWFLEQEMLRKNKGEKHKNCSLVF